MQAQRPSSFFIGLSMDSSSPGKLEATAEQVTPFSWVPWLTAACGSFLIFVILTWLIRVDERVSNFDLSCAGIMQEHAGNNEAIRNFFWLMTCLGGTVGLALLASAGTLTMFLRKEYLLAAIWVLATAGGALVNLSVKYTVHRERPKPNTRDPFVEHFHNPSYPSGHAMGSAIGLGICLFAVLRFLKRQRGKILTAAALILLILLIGFSRVYLRAHWLTDVLGGFALGTSWLIFCLAIHERLRRY